ncbi:MAG: hypothetical protein WKF75_09995 [Singulisphaera sp.]
MILVCGCGMRLKAAGAYPGRLGKCPACGAPLRVPDLAPPAPPPSPPPAQSHDATQSDRAEPKPSAARSSTFVASPGRSGPTSSRRDAESRGDWNGLLPVPARPETRLRESLLYPFWGVTGLALLVFLPPALWITSLPTLGMLTLTSSLPGQVQLAGVLGLLPVTFGFALVSGYVLLVLGRVLATSALGEVHHPRWPEWDLGDMLRGLGRWLWAGLIGGGVGGLPMVLYWMYCGDIDLLDRIIFAELFALGACYALMALLASILHEDALGANPITVIRAIRRVGWGYWRPCLICGAALMLAGTALAAVFEVSNPALAALAYWLFWVFILYEAIVVLRVLGLFYHRHARVLGWFRERPRWGV